jgi:hypothetical protein
MSNVAFKDRVDLDHMITELDRQLEELYRHIDVATRPEVWAKLTNATLKLVAPEDQDYAYDQLYAVFRARQTHPSANAAPDASAIESRTA